MDLKGRNIRARQLAKRFVTQVEISSIQTLQFDECSGPDSQVLRPPNACGSNTQTLFNLPMPWEGKIRVLTLAQSLPTSDTRALFDSEAKASRPSAASSRGNKRRGSAERVSVPLLSGEWSQNFTPWLLPPKGSSIEKSEPGVSCP